MSLSQQAAQSQPPVTVPREQHPDKIGVRRENAATLISRIQICQELQAEIQAKLADRS